MTEPSTSIFRRLPPWLRQLLPVLVSALILYYYFRGQDWAELWKAVERADIALAVLAVVVPQLVFWWFESLVWTRHVEWFHRPVPFSRVFWVRGAVYILQLINTPLGSGGILLYLQRKARMSWRKLLGITLFRYGLILWGLGILLIPATAAMQFYGYAEEVRLNLWVWWGVLLFGVLYLVEVWLVWHRGMNFGLARWTLRNRETEFWTAFRVASRKQWFLTWAMTIPPFVIMMLGLYLLARAFQLEIPFWKFMVLSPLAFLIMDLPIAFAAFGSTTLAWELFFSGHGDPEALFALTLFFPAVRSLCRAAVGLVSLRPAIAEITGPFEETGTDLD